MHSKLLFFHYLFRSKIFTFFWGLGQPSSLFSLRYDPLCSSLCSNLKFTSSRHLNCVNLIIKLLDKKNYFQIIYKLFIKDFKEH